jgi:ABC-type sugar transport system permease subunit
MSRAQSRVFPYLMAGPYVAMFAVFVAYPVGRALYMSLFDWGIFGPNAFVGLGNYLSLFSDRRFWSSLWITSLFALMYVPMMMVISVVLAVMLHRKLPAIGIFRTAFFLPIVINIAVAAIAFQWMFEPGIGTIDTILKTFGLPGQKWLTQPGWALFVISLVTLWINVGFMVIILLAGLENIPDEIYDASKLDGSSPLDDLVNITVPLLRPIMLIVMILSIVQAFQIFGEVLIITQGGPFGSTTVLTMLLYEEGFERFALGRAAAIGVVITLIIAVLSGIQFRFFRQQA